MRTARPLVALLILAASSTAWGQTDSSTVALAPAVPPKLQRLVKAELPPGTVFESPEVQILLEIQLTATGSVSSVALLEGAGEPFDEAAVTAARQFEFEPARAADGTPVPVTVTFRMRISAPVPAPAPLPEVAEAPPPAPPVVYRGIVKQRGTRKPMGGVDVRALADGEMLAEGFTEPDGKFELTVRTSTFTVEVTPTDGEQLRLQVTASPGDVLQETLYVTAATSRYEVIVRSRAARPEVIERRVRREEVFKAPGTTGDAIKVIQNLPGVARPSFGGGPLVLRGAAPGDSVTFLDGQEIPQIYHFGGLRSTFNSAFLDEVNFVPGNFGPEFGRATGGVVDVRVRDPADDLLRGAVDVNLYDASFHLEGPATEDLSVGGAFRRSYIDTILPAVLPDDASVTFNSAPRFYDYQLITTYKPRKKEKFRGLFYGSLDKVEILFAEPAEQDPVIRGPLQTRTMFHNIQLEYTNNRIANLEQELSLQIGTGGFKFDLGPDFFFDLDIRRISLRGTWTYDFNEWLDIRGGIDARYFNVGLRIAAPFPPKEGEQPPPLAASERRGLSTTSNVVDPAVFVEARLTPLKDLTVVPSLRVDYYSILETFTLDPRLFAQYRLSKQSSLRLGVGLYQQQPQFDESGEEFGNPDLLPERSTQLSLGMTQSLFDEAVSVEVTGFYKALDRQVVRNDAAFTDPDLPPYTNEGTGRIFGAEILIKARFEPGFFGWIAYTFQRSFRTDGPDEQERLFDFDQPHILTALASYEIGSGWTVGARFRLVSGNPDTPVLGSELDTYSGVFVPLYGPTNSGRLGTFHQLDVRVDKVWTFDTWRLNLYLDVQNTYNRANPEGYIYNFDFSQRTPLSGLPLVPILGLKGDW